MYYFAILHHSCVFELHGQAGVMQVAPKGETMYLLVFLALYGPVVLHLAGLPTNGLAGGTCTTNTYETKASRSSPRDNRNRLEVLSPARGSALLYIGKAKGGRRGKVKPVDHSYPSTLFPFDVSALGRKRVADPYFQGQQRMNTNLCTEIYQRRCASRP